MNETMNNGMYYGGYPFQGYYPQYGYQPVMPQQPFQVPQTVNALTDEEIGELRNARPSTSIINLNVDHNDVLRSMCTHKDKGRDTVVMVNDGSGDVACTLCGERWNPEITTKEELYECINRIISSMQNAKAYGDLPIEMVREFFVIMPLLKKWPDIYEYCINNLNKQFRQISMNYDSDASVYAMYNYLASPQPFFGANMGYGMPMQGQPMQAAPQQPTFYYNGQGGNQPPVQQNQFVNPMQAPAYGVNPFAPNQQFVQQAATMMPGFGMPAQGQPMQPTFATPNAAPQAYQPGVVTQPVQPQQAAAAATPDADGNVTTEHAVKL